MAAAVRTDRSKNSEKNVSSKHSGFPLENKKIIILTAPSGAGKTTIKSRLLANLPDVLSFSVSVTTRKMREGEKDGIDYIFISQEAFTKKIEDEGFVEWQMVYPGMYYGTTVEEMERIWHEGKTPLLDIDVKGAVNVKEMYGDKVLSIFIEPPSIEVLKERLIKRGADSAEQIQLRVDKAKEELGFRDCFDKVIENIEIDKASGEAMTAIKSFLKIG